MEGRRLEGTRARPPPPETRALPRLPPPLSRPARARAPARAHHHCSLYLSLLSLSLAALSTVDATPPSKVRVLTHTLRPFSPRSRARQSAHPPAPAPAPAPPHALSRRCLTPCTAEGADSAIFQGQDPLRRRRRPCQGALSSPHTRARTRTRATPPRSLSRSTLTPTLLPPRYRSSHALLPFPPRSLGQHSTRSMCDLPPHPHPYPARIRARTRTRVPHALSLSHTHAAVSHPARQEGWQMEGPRARLSPLETRALPRYHPPPPPAGPHARAHRRGSLSLLAFSRRRSSLSYIGSG